jgi:predicted nucleic acid-binding protein
VLTPGEVFAETLNVVGKRFGHAVALELAGVLVDSELFVIEETGDEMRLAALQRFARQPESVSFTDCVVMAMADHFDTTEIFGFDQAFATNGYHIPTRDEWPGDGS